MAASDSLELIPDSINVGFLPSSENLSDRVLSKGLNYYTQGYIHALKTFENAGRVNVTAKCWRSMKKGERPHELRIDIYIDRITDSYCSCKAGLNGHCSHIVGLLKSLQSFKLHGFKSVPDMLSCTSMPQQWHVPRGEKITPVPIQQVVVAKPSVVPKKRKPVLCQPEITSLPDVTATDIESLKAAEGTPLHYMVSPKAPKVMTKLGEVQIGSLLSYQTRNFSRKLQQPTPANEGCGNMSVTNPSPVKLPDHFKFLQKIYKVDDPERLEAETRQQSESPEWFNARQNRLTASNFGQIVNRKSALNEKLLNRVFGCCSELSVPSISYGKNNESKAKAKYLAINPRNHIHDCGFIVNNEFPFLGATPDGKLCDGGKFGIIEIKCPYNARDMTIEQAVSTIPDFYLEQNGNSFSLKQKHHYYAQVQGQLMVTGCNFCDFIVYCPKEKALFVQRIKPDVDFMTNMLNTLSSFFATYAHPFLSRVTVSD